MISGRAAALFLGLPWLCAGQISGTVRDPTGAPVVRASVALAAQGASAQQTSATDAQGRFHFDGLTAGSYRLTVSRAGFEPYTRTVEFAARPVELSLALELESVRTSVTVASGSLRNTDPNYQSLRKGQLQQVWRVNNLVLRRDAATLTFRSGSFSFMPPVLGRVAGAVFVGDGNLKLVPGSAVAARYMKALTHAGSVDEDFTSLVVYFTDSTYEEITANAERVDEPPKPLQSVLDEVRSESRRRTDMPVSYLGLLLGDDDVPNAEADILARLYNRENGVFRSFVHGKKHSKLRYIVDPRGALPMMPAPEEVALFNFATLLETDGIWYLGHLASEVAAARANSKEDHRLIAPESYRMDVSVANSLTITSKCSLRFHTLAPDVRMVRFQLLPDLEVSSVNFDGNSIPFVQESRRQDGSFYVQFPQALTGGAVHELAFTYSGGEYIREAQTQSVYRIQPLRPWYPRVDSTSRAQFDMTFHVPHGITAVSVGKLVRNAREGSHDIFEWASDAPLPPAGFNYGAYVLSQQRDAKTGYLMESYLAPPSRTVAVMKGSGMSARVEAGNSTSAVSDVALSNARNSVELFEHWYGPLPYGRLAVVESLYAGSLPTLLFMPGVTIGAIPMRAYENGAVSRMERILDEALPSVASRQWWGALVMPASFHEEWMTRGLADFSGALYDEASGEAGNVRSHWSVSHDALLRLDFYGLKLSQAPPVWWGPLIDLHSTIPTPSGPRLYQFVSNTVLPLKGGYILHMLRELMRDPQTGDRDFIAMMHDFTASFANRSASTEDFRAIVEKHMKPAMILDRTGNMQWFFDEWVYGNEMPSYRLDYTLDRADAGRFKLSGLITQSGVSDSFRMRVRVYARIGKNPAPVVYVAVAGNRSARFETVLPEEPKEVLLNAQHDVLAEHQEVHRVKVLPL